MQVNVAVLWMLVVAGVLAIVLGMEDGGEMSSAPFDVREKAVKKGGII